MGQLFSNCLRPDKADREENEGQHQSGQDPQQKQQQQQEHDQQQSVHDGNEPHRQYDSQGGRVFPEAEKHRQEAHRHAEMRGEKLAESQRAYQAGSKRNAHELSVEGKRHGRLMEEANARAVQAILQPQNSNETGILDLHGLYVKEAESATKHFILEQQRAKRFLEVEIITGAGRHSVDHQAKIKPAIEHLVNELNLPYHSPLNNGGALVVELYSNQ